MTSIRKFYALRVFLNLDRESTDMVTSLNATVKNDVFIGRHAEYPMVYWS